MSIKRIVTLRALIGLGFTIAVLPLLLAIYFATTGIRETTEFGRKLNSDVFEQTKTIRLVLQKAADVERKARLFVLLSDPALRQPYEKQSYETARAGFKQALTDLRRLQVDNKIALLASELAEKENLIYHRIISLADDNDVRMPIDDAFQGLRESSYNLSREFESYVDQQFERLSQHSESFSQALLFKAAVLLGLSLACIATLVLTIAKSLRQLDNAIDSLTSGDLLRAIEISGPADLERMGRKLEWLRNSLADLRKAKQVLMLNFAHEIELPLEEMRTSCEILSSRVDDEQQKTVADLNTNLEKFELMRQQFNRYARLADTLNLPPAESVDLQDLANTVIDSFQQILARKSLKITAELQTVRIIGHIQQLRTLLEELITNALHFSAPQSEIRVSLWESDTGAELLIEDEGTGIPPNQRERVFEPFFRHSLTPDGNTVYSCGLGLALAKELVNNHRGSIEALHPRHRHSGSSIHVHLPYDYLRSVG